MKKYGKHWLSKSALSLLLVLVMLVSFALEAMATDVYYAVDTDGKQYTSIDSAWSAAQNGHVITMLRDWTLGDRLVLGEGKTAKIYMSGHKIDRNLSDSEGDGEVIYLSEGSNLTLMGYSDPESGVAIYTDIPYKAWYSTGTHYSTYIKTGGLVTGGWSTNGAGGVHMKEGSTLTIDNVAVSGNQADTNWLGSNGYGGGIMMDGESTALIMKNSAIISYNSALDDGGGVYINNAKGTVTMTGSTINYNYAAGNGGGIYGDSTNHLIYLNEGSMIVGNSAKEGGGIYLSDTDFVIRSSDSKAGISYNTARDGSGGAIYIDSQPGSNSGIIQGIKMSCNTCSKYGGAIYLHQEQTSVSRCTITDNRAYEGGGIYNNNDDNTISGCTITENKATHEGGGVYSSCQNDIGLGGTLIIENNTRTDGAKDDLFLNDTNSSSAYLTSTPSANSRVGIRTAKTLRMIGRRTFFNSSAFFSDFDGCHIEYDASSNELWVKSGSVEDSISYTQVGSQDKTTVGTFNGEPVVRGYFSYASVADSTADLDSNYYYSDGYFLFGEDSYYREADADMRGDPREYNPHLASMSMAMALAGFYSNIGNDGKLGTENDLTYTYKSQNIEKLLVDIGVDTDDVYISDTYSVKPGTDTIGVAIGKKEIGSGYTLIPIVVRGAGYESEWTSNVTVGTSGEHNGFASAANQIIKHVQKYIENYDLTEAVQNGTVKFWVMGYSRGGATANLTAKRLVEAYCDGSSVSMNNQVYAYCFEAPQGGRNSEMQLDAPKYYCIHNCINKADLVPEVAPDEMGFIRYGVDHYVPGESGAATPKSDTSVWHYVKNQDWAKSYAAWYDNKSYEVGSTEYQAQRAKMLAQLESVDPENFDFCDNFTIAELNYIDSPFFSTSDLKPDGDPVTQEQYIHVFIRALLAWGLPGSGGDLRARFCSTGSDYGTKLQSFEDSLRAVVPVVFGKTSEELEGILNSVMAGFNSISTAIDFSGHALADLYGYVIRGWNNYKIKFSWTQSKRQGWADFLWKSLILTQGADGKAASDYLTSSEYEKLNTVWYSLLNVLLRFVCQDYNTDINDWAKTKDCSDTTANLVELYTGHHLSYGSDAQVIVGTLMRNTTSLAQAHYPEVNFAWLRSYDSYYSNDVNSPVVIETDGSTEIPSVDVSCSSDGVLSLETDIAGAGVFYRVKVGESTEYSNWMPYNLPVSLATFRPEGDTTTVDFTVQVTAVYCGKVSAVRTVAAGIWKDKAFSVWVNGEEIGSYKPGSIVTVDGTSEDSGKAFRKWSDSVGISLDSLDNVNSAVTTFTMPEENVGLLAEYVTRIDSVTLTVDTPQAGKTMPTQGTLTWGDNSVQVDLFWLENVETGTPYAGSKAGYGKKYSVAAVVKQDLAAGIVFASGMDEQAVTVTYAGYSTGSAFRAYTDAAGALRIFGGQVETEKAKIRVVSSLAVSLQAGAGIGDLLAKLPGSVAAITEAGVTSLKTDPSHADMTGAIDENGAFINGGVVKIPLVISESDSIVNPETNPKSFIVHVYISAATPAEAPTSSATESSAAAANAVAVMDTKDDTESDGLMALSARRAVLSESIPCLDIASVVSACAIEYDAPVLPQAESNAAESEIETYSGSSILVTLGSATEGSVIKYTINEGEEQIYTGPFELVGEEGEETIFIVTSWAEAANHGRSSETVKVYILDNPFTLTIHGKDTGLKGAQGEELWVKEYRYYKGETIRIGAPAEQDELFERWESVPAGVEGSVTDTALTIKDMSGDIEITAIYNPVVSRLELTLDAPVSGKKLPSKVRAAYATVTERYPLTGYFADIRWTPSAGTGVAESGTVYTAKLMLKADSGSGNDSALKYFLSENLEIVVNGGDSRIKASVAKENTAIYVTFPATASAVEEKVTVVAVEELVGVGVSHEDAAAGKWGLPQQATLVLSAGGKIKADITWSGFEPAFDGENLGTQVLKAVGTVTAPEGVAMGTVSNEVSVTVYVASTAGQVFMPYASVASGSYEKQQYVRLYCATDDVAIYYTTDGTQPTEQSTLYSGGTILISDSVTLKMIAVKDGVQSLEASYSYTIQTDGSSGDETATAAAESDTAADTADTDTDTDTDKAADADTDTDTESVILAESDTETDSQSGGGCSSAVGGAGALAVLILAVAAAAALKKRARKSL